MQGKGLGLLLKIGCTAVDLKSASAGMPFLRNRNGHGQLPFPFEFVADRYCR
jgi:hypothetical protein